MRLSVALFGFLASGAVLAAPPKETPAAAAASPSDEAFHATISPILLTRCSPCHAKGGSQYAKLPFDKPATIRAHTPGVLKRLKGDDKEAVQGWLAGR